MAGLLPRMVSTGIRRWCKDDRGSVAVTYIGAMTMLMGIGGLAIETGDWYMSRQQLKTATDAAVLAVASRALDGGDAATLRGLAEEVLRRHGFDPNGQTQSTADDVVLADLGRPAGSELLAHLPAATAAMLATDGWMARTSTRKDFLLASVVMGRAAGSRGIAISTVSIAGVGSDADKTGVVQPKCMIGLNDSGTSIRVNGAAFSLPEGCGFHANDDMDVNGNNRSVAEAPISVTGQFNGSIQPANLITGVDPMPDPYAGLSMDEDWPECTHDGLSAMAAADMSRRFAATAPRVGGLRAGGGHSGNPHLVRIKNSDPTEFNANGGVFVFCNGVNFRDDTTFGPGIYVFKGGFDISGAAVTATHATFILADMDPDRIKITGNGSLSITAPTTDYVEGLSEPARSTMEPWIGIALYGDRDTFSGGNASFGGNIDLNIDGVIYAPSAGLDIHGNVGSNSGSCMRIVAHYVEFSGSVDLEADECTDLFGDVVDRLNLEEYLVRLQPRLYY